MLGTSGSNVLEFKVNFTVTKKVKSGCLGFGGESEDFDVLKNVKGRIESGTMTALLGASGCGKSTLLAALSQRLRGRVKSDIRLNREVVDRTKMTNISSFVPQADIFVEGLTVHEHFYFMIELKLPNISKYEKQFLIESSLTKFGLNGGTKLKYLSGGEKRKLSLASELLTKPQILFCDEPTSGLDSFSAFAVMNTLREIARFIEEPSTFSKPAAANSRIVLFSIHQPTSEIFQLFTNIILMNAGRIIFHGTVHEAKELFNTIGMPCPPRYNPAEFYINRISDPQVAGDVFRQVDMQKMVDEVEVSNNYSSESSLEQEIMLRSKVSWVRQVILLSYRSILDFLNSPRHYLIELSIFMILACIVTASYHETSFSRDTAVQDIKGFLFILSTEALFTFVYAVFYMVYEVMPLLRKETGDKLYSLSAYYVSMVLMTIPRVVLETFFYTALVYFPTDIGRSVTVYLNISISIALSGICGLAYGFFLSGLFESLFIATELSSIVDLILLMFSGAYISVKSFPWLKYISFFFYANETVAISFWHPIQHIKCSPNPELTCFHNGTTVLESMSFGTTEADVLKDYLYQLILTIVLHFLAFIGLRRNVRRTGFY